MNESAKRLHDEALGLMPEHAQHDRELCPFCFAETAGASEIPPTDGRSGDDPHRNKTASDRATEGGMREQMDTITQETHEALLTKAVDDAVADTKAENARLQETVATLTQERDTAKAEVTTLTEENARLNGELDEAQIQLKTVQDEKAALESDVAERDEEARKAGIASTRADQVRNLNLFPEDHIQEKARKWAEVPDEDWAERLEEWKSVRGAPEPGQSTEPAPSTETASAMSGSAEGSSTTKPSPRRAVLGLS